MNFIDLSHTVKSGEITYKGLPPPLVCDFLSREESKAFYKDEVTFHIGKIEMVGNTGTYIDCPFHRYEDGKDISEVALTKFVELEVSLVQVDYKVYGKKLDYNHFENLNVKGKAVLVQTNWSDKWGTDEYFKQSPYLTKEAAELLKNHGAALVGIDSLNIDNIEDSSRPVHSILLKEEILIVEHLTNLRSIPIEKRCWFNAIPPKIKGVGTFSVRAFVKIDEQ